MTNLYALFNEAAYDDCGRPRIGRVASLKSFVRFTTESPFTGTPKLKEFFDENGNAIEYNVVMDWRDIESTSLEYVTFLAQKATEQFGTLYVPTNNASMSRFGITEVPKVGDPVSYAFNGDCTPCGEIVRLTPALTVITSTGKRFRRVKQSGAWVMEGGTWSLVHGHISERNPHI